MRGFPWKGHCACGQKASVVYNYRYFCGRCADDHLGEIPAMEWKLIEKASA